MKVIDFEKRGNVVRFYLGADDCTDYWGDDWNDSPYEHNADQVYHEYVKAYVDIGFSLDFTVVEPADDWRNHGNSSWSKEDFKLHKCPCICIQKGNDTSSYSTDLFNKTIADKNSIKIYFDDDFNELKTKIHFFGGIILNTKLNKGEN